MSGERKSLDGAYTFIGITPPHEIPMEEFTAEHPVLTRTAREMMAEDSKTACDPISRPLQFHLDRVDAWLTELWAAKSIDVHDCSGETRANQFGLLHDIREDVHRLRKEATTPRPSELVAALRGMLNRYVELVNSGDCGHWNPEDEDEVKAARSALTTEGQTAAPATPGKGG